MLASYTFVATFVLCLLISFTEISQGSENQPNSVNDGIFDLNYYEGLIFGGIFNVVFLTDSLLLVHTPFVYCARKRFLTFSFLFLIMNHCLHMFQIP